MSNFTITANDMKKLKKLVSKAIEAEEDVDDAIDAWKATLKAVKAGKTKKAKNPDQAAMVEAIGKAPRAKSAYIFFGSENRAKIKKENPDAKPTEMTTLISEAWNKIKDDKKKAAKYHKMADEDKKKVEKEKVSYEKKKKAYLAKKGAEGSDDEEVSGDEEEKPKGKGKAAPKGKGKAVKKPVEEEKSSEDEESEEEKPKGKAGKGKPAKADSPKEDESEEDVEKTVDYKKMKLPELKALAKERGVDIKGKTKKEDIVAALEAVAGGDADDSATEKDEEEVESEE